MTKPIEELSESDLKQKIENIKAEREKTANALKRYEEELERRNKEVPLGVPAQKRKKNYWKISGSLELEDFIDEGDEIDNRLFECMNYFSSVDSAQKHAEMLFAWRKALVANAKGEPIDIKVLCPLLPKGWVAYEKEYGWIWFKNKPFILSGIEEGETWSNEGSYGIIGGFNIKPAENWRESLMECGL